MRSPKSLLPLTTNLMRFGVRHGDVTSKLLAEEVVISENLQCKDLHVPNLFILWICVYSISSGAS